MSDFDWKAMVKTVAPGLAAALGGPLARIAVTAIGKALGLDAATEEIVKTVLAGATPADMLKLKQAELDFQGHMRELDIDLERIAQQDRGSARGREVSLRDWTPRLLAGLVVVVWATGSWELLHHTVPPGSEAVLGRVLGTLDAALMLVLSYYFGSSAGSERKNELLAGSKK